MIRERTLVSTSGALLLGMALLAAAGGCGERESEDLQPDHRAGGEGSTTESAAASDAAPAATDPAPSSGDVAALAPLLASAAESPTLDDAQRRALEQAMQRVLQPAAAVCDGCSTEVSYVDEAGGGDHFRGDIRGASGDVMADLEIYPRRDLAPDSAKAWARTTLAGHPAAAFGGEHLFVWPGRLEIRAFARGDALRDQRSLEDLLSRLPLDALAKL